MAINPNFVFTDAVPAQQAVQMAQIAAAEDAARRQQQNETLRAITAQNVARQNAAEQRALTQQQMAQQNKVLAQNDRQFNMDAAIRQSDLDRRFNLDKNRGTLDRSNTRFNTIQTAIETDDPPTESEFEGLLKRFAADLLPEDQDQLRMMRKTRVNALTRQAELGEQLANRWNTMLSDPNIGPAQKSEIMSNADKQHGKFIIFDPSTQRYQSLFRRPRTDMLGPNIPPGGIPTPERVTSVESLRSPSTGGIGGMISGVADLLRKLPAPGAINLPDAVNWNPIIKYGIGYNPMLQGIRSLFSGQGESAPQPPNTNSIPFYPR